MTDIEKGAFNNVKYIIEKAPMNNINKIEFDVGSIIYQNIQTLLNLIKTQQKALEQKDKEIAEERIKYISSNLNNTIILKQKEDEQLSALNEGWKIELEQKDKEIQELKADRVEKDKIIKAMAKYLNSTDIDEDICRVVSNKFDCTLYQNEEFCIDCIIEYFKEKVSEENE